MPRQKVITVSYRDQILMLTKERPLLLNQIRDELCAYGDQSRQRIRKILSELIEEGKIVYQGDGTYLGTEELGGVPMWVESIK